MRFKVVKLRQWGKRLARQHILDAPAVCGDVGIISMPDEQGMPTRIAVLRSSNASVNNCLEQLFEPEIVAITSQAFLLKGVERDDGGSEMIQEWWCRF